MRPLGAIALITFDCTGTLFKTRKPIATQYMQALREVAGPSKLDAIAAVDEQLIESAFLMAYRKACHARPCFGHATVGDRTWWHDVVSETFAGAGLPANAADSLLPDTFDRLWNRFCSSDGFELLPHAAECLHRLHTRENASPRIGVVSNWDSRLPSLLDDLGVAKYIDAIVTSGEVGCEKPDVRIFEEAKRQLGVPADGARLMHVGDSWSRDVLGARAAGFEAVYVGSQAVSAAVRAEMEATPHIALQSLELLCEQLELDSS